MFSADSPDHATHLHFKQGEQRKMVAHSEVLLSKCAQFRDDGQFINVRLKVREDIFPAHRIVLAANSDYFHAMFTDGMKESNKGIIELKEDSISPEIFVSTEKTCLKFLPQLITFK